MDNDREGMGFEEIVDYFSACAPLHEDDNKLLLVSIECSNYQTASFIYERFMELLEKDCSTSNLRVLVRFLDICWEDLTRMVTPEGATDCVGLFLDFSQKVHTDFWIAFNEKGLIPVYFPSQCPVNQCFIFGRLVNIPLLLHYGLELEFPDIFDFLLQNIVINDHVPRSQRKACFIEMKEHPSPIRKCLVLLVISTLSYKNLPPAVIKQSNNALKMIWRSIPDPYLCRLEIVAVFYGVERNSRRLHRISKHYEEFICEGKFTRLPQPRSLLHHCRYQIRFVMSLNKELPTGVNKLLLPVKLKKYLLLDSMYS